MREIRFLIYYAYNIYKYNVKKLQFGYGFKYHEDLCHRKMYLKRPLIRKYNFSRNKTYS